MGRILESRHTANAVLKENLIGEQLLCMLSTNVPYFTRDAEKFLKRENLRSETVAEIINFLKRMKGESVSVDVKKLKGD